MSKRQLNVSESWFDMVEVVVVCGSYGGFTAEKYDGVINDES